MILEVDNIELSFGGKCLLYGIYLKAETGKVTGVLGRNGCGKSCLLQIIFGSLSPKYKNVRIDGSFQKKELYLTNNIAYLPQYDLLPKKIRLHRAFELFNVSWSSFLNDFGAFQKYRNTRVSNLSHGQLRIVETYLVLFMQKEIVILDEPFSFIAPLYVDTFKKLITKRKESCALIITDHFYQDVLDISDSVYYIENGLSRPIKSKSDLLNTAYIHLE